MRVTVRGPNGTQSVEIPPSRFGNRTATQNQRIAQRILAEQFGSPDVQASPIQIDRDSGTEKARQIVNKLVRDVADKDIDKKQELIRSTVAATTDNVIDGFFKTVAKLYMTANGVNEATKDGAHWVPLSIPYLRRKRKEGRLIHHWAYRRTLRSRFSRTNALPLLGETQVALRKYTGNGQRGQLQRRQLVVSYAPDVFSILGDDLTPVHWRDFDSTLHSIGAISDQDFAKLWGPSRQFYRALLGPAFQRLTTKVLRLRIRQALGRLNLKVRTLRDDGAFDGGGGASIPTGSGGTS